MFQKNLYKYSYNWNEFKNETLIQNSEVYLKLKKNSALHIPHSVLQQNLAHFGRLREISRTAKSRHYGKPHQLKRAFSNILSQSKSALEDSILKKTVPRKNCVGEFYEDSKILNEQERLVALKMAIDLRNLKKNNQVQKKTQSSQSNQSSLNPKVRKYDAFVQSQQTDLEEEISYKKLKFTQ